MSGVIEMNSRDLPSTADRAGPTALLPVGPATHTSAGSQVPAGDNGSPSKPSLDDGGAKIERWANTDQDRRLHWNTQSRQAVSHFWTYFKARHNEPWRAV